MSSYSMEHYQYLYDQMAEKQLRREEKRQEKAFWTSFGINAALQIGGTIFDAAQNNKTTKTEGTPETSSKSGSIFTTITQQQNQNVKGTTNTEKTEPTQNILSDDDVNKIISDLAKDMGIKLNDSDKKALRDKYRNFVRDFGKDFANKQIKTSIGLYKINYPPKQKYTKGTATAEKLTVDWEQTRKDKENAGIYKKFGI